MSEKKPIVRALLHGDPHQNHGLFSDHYLNETLPDRLDWQQLATSAEVTQCLTDLRQLLTTYVPTSNEAQTEEGLIKPVLEALGHAFEVQPSLDTPGIRTTPDYVFYVDDAARNSNKNIKLTEAALADRAYAVGDAKYWDRKLDVSVKSGSDLKTNANPSWQIDFYIRYSGLSWGILTNGRLWRLYHKDSSKRLDRYYEVDLPALLEEGDPARFVYFHAFFSRRAFTGWKLGVDALLHESDHYAKQVGDTLRLQVFTALRHLAQGFLDHTRNDLKPDPPTLKQIYDNSLIILYRLLFILYAEARGLLPVEDNALYRESYSLEAVKRDVLKGRPLLAHSDMIWARLRTLFNAINEGSPPLGIATYNGGLFDPARHPFIARFTVGDAHLQLAIDQLARVDGSFVDYRDLAVRHLGTIYEGLLEFHLFPLEAPEGHWTIGLRNDNGERHGTGSYYTPDGIVAYMVAETLEPLLRRAVADAKSDAAKVAAVLSLNVLDMAMGSGHFLVEATDYIAHFLVGLGLAPVDAQGEAELPYWRRHVVQACIYGVDLNPLAVDLAKLSLWLITVARDRPLSFLDHRLRTGNALVGARLATLSAAASGAPKNKAKAKAVHPDQLALFSGEDFRQRMSTAVDSMWLIEGSDGATVAEVKEQERLYEEFRARLSGIYGTLAHVLTAQHFGLAMDLPSMGFLKLYALGQALTVPRQLQTMIEMVDVLSREQHFFHWELEFPEVFFDRHGQPLGDKAGFDAVLGNPPYVRQEGLKPFKPYFAHAFPETYHAVADLYVYFYQQGLQLTRAGGRMSYIVTNKWLRSGYGEPLRGYFADQGALERIIDFGHTKIFEDADVFPCIVLLDRPAPGDPAVERQVRMTAFPREDYTPTVNLARYVAEHSHQVPHARLGKPAWSLEHSAVNALLEKIRHAGTPLAEFAGVKPYRGVLTGFNEAFLIDTPTRDRLLRDDPGCAEIIKPYLRGQDIKRWAPDWQKLWMLVLASSGDRRWPWSESADPEQAEQIFAATYPSVHGHFLPFVDALKKRQDQGRFWWELRSCAYYEVFVRPKLLYQEIQFHPSFCIDKTGTLANNKVFMLGQDAPYLLAVLNSPLMWWHNWRFLPHMKDEALSPTAVLMETLPIAPPTDAILAEAEPAVARLVALARSIQEGQRDLLAWLSTEFGIGAPGQRLETVAGLSEEQFVTEVRKRLPGKSSKLTPGTLRALREG